MLDTNGNVFSISGSFSWLLPRVAQRYMVVVGPSGETEGELRRSPVDCLALAYFSH